MSNQETAGRNQMEWNSITGRYEGYTAEGLLLCVHADEFAEHLQQYEKDGVDTDELWSVATWESLIGVNPGVWYDF